MKTSIATLFMLLALTGMQLKAQTAKKQILRVDYTTSPGSPKLLEIIRLQIKDPVLLQKTVNLIDKYKYYFTLNVNLQTSESVFKLDSVTKVEKVKVVGNGEYGFRNKDNGYLCNENFMSSNYTIKGSVKDLQWEIKEDTLTLGGYKCVKATLKQMPDVIVWFTPDIPVSSGPYMFHGLPGLVMKMQNNFEETIATRVAYQGDVNVFNTDAENIMAKSKSTKIVSLSEIVVAKSNFMRMIESKTSKD